MKNSRAAIQSRQNEILQLLKKQGKMPVSLLAERLGVTETTIRRDLVQMEKAGFIRRSFGNAELSAVDDMRQIEPTNIEDEKELTRRKIARKAAEYVEDGDVIFLNSSGTASLILEYLAGKNVTVLTNNARVISRPHGPNVQLLLVGGEVYGKKQSLIGQFALDTIGRVVATKCIMGVSGISADGGLTSVILPETQVNILMLQQCRGPRIVVADGSKVGLVQNYFSGNLSDITHLITDSGADDRSVHDIIQAGVIVETV